MIQIALLRLSLTILKYLQRLSVNPIPVIAIDGPSASGKGSVAERVASRLGFHYLDSGALYRIVALAGKKHQIDWSDGKALGVLIPDLDIVFKDAKVYLNGQDVSQEIRSPEMGNGASQVAIHPEVRNALFALQQSFRKPPGLVADGRDMASVVFTDAVLKIFLTANVEERASRRFKQLIGNNVVANFDDILQDLKARDLRDSTRSSAPLLQEKDAILLNTDNLNITQAVDFILSKYQLFQQTQSSQQ
jgi:cytidylate kinase